jgi:hypothetical protein
MFILNIKEKVANCIAENSYKNSYNNKKAGLRNTKLSKNDCFIKYNSVLSQNFGASPIKKSLDIAENWNRQSLDLCEIMFRSMKENYNYRGGDKLVISDLNNEINLNPKKAILYWCRCIVNDIMGNHKEADKDFKIVEEIDSRFFDKLSEDRTKREKVMESEPNLYNLLYQNSVKIWRESDELAKIWKSDS